MRRVILGVSVGWMLACGGAVPAPDATGGGAVTAAPASDPGQLVGRWCENDPEVGCYRFEGDTVIEEPVKNKRGTSGESRGPWRIEGKMLILDFPEGNWTLEIIDRTSSVLLVKDHSQNDTFTFTRADL